LACEAAHTTAPIEGTRVMKTRVFLSLLLVAAALLLPVGTRPAHAGGYVIRMATIAPNTSKPMRILRAWDNSVKKATNGQVSFRFYAGGVAGDERDVLRKMRVGQLDAGTFTSVGLGQIVRSATVLQVPGLFDSYADLDAVRHEMSGEWDRSFSDAGYQLLGWFDIGFGRIFSKHPVEKPSDLKRARPWVWRDDPVFPELMHGIGANGVPLGLPEVFPALQTGMVDTVVASPVAALGLQWFRHVGYMSKQADTALVGATIISHKLFKQLPPDAQEVVVETGRQAHAQALHLVKSEEQIAYETLKKRGIQETDLKPHAKEWNAAYDALKQRLVGRLFTKELLDRVESAAAKAGS